MSEVDLFIKKFSGLTEEYKFYNGTVTLRYDPKDHVYLLVKPDGTLERQEGVTNICHILDKSNVLIPWACKMMEQKLIASIPFTEGSAVLNYDSFIKAVNLSKSAHKDKLEDAGEVGHAAHAWIENYIKWVLNQTHTLPLMPFDERAQSACLAALNWMDRHNVRWILTERKVYSRKHKFAGTMDGLCFVDSCDNPNCCKHFFKDRRTISDWKTSNYLYIEFILQTAAYKSAYEEETGETIEDIWVIRLDKQTAQFDPWHVRSELAEIGWTAFLKALDLKREMDLVEEEVQLMKDDKINARKIEKAEKKAEDLKVKCKSADRYKGKRKPVCNGGHPCDTCLKKYEIEQEAKSQRLKDLVKKEVIKETNVSHDLLEKLQKVLDKPATV